MADKVHPRVRDLEIAICEYQKKIADTIVILGQKEISLKYARERQVEARERYERHRKNQKFSRTKADVVDIKEHGATLRMMGDAKGDFEDAVIKVAALQQALDLFQGLVDDNKRKIELARAELSEYGEVIQWKKK